METPKSNLPGKHFWLRPGHKDGHDQHHQQQQSMKF